MLVCRVRECGLRDLRLDFGRSSLSRARWITGGGKLRPLTDKVKAAMNWQGGGNGGVGGGGESLPPEILPGADHRGSGPGRGDLPLQAYSPGSPASGRPNFRRRLATSYLNASVAGQQARFVEMVRRLMLEGETSAVSVYLLKADGGTMTLEDSPRSAGGNNPDRAGCQLDGCPSPEQIIRRAMLSS